MMQRDNANGRYVHDEMCCYTGSKAQLSGRAEKFPVFCRIMECPIA
jgi:hypothetical protein